MRGLADLLERRAADVLHDDVADGAPAPSRCSTKLWIRTMFGCSTSARRSTSAAAAAMASASPELMQALEHDPAVVHVAVDRQVDPAEAAVCEAALHFVLAADEVAARKLGNERVSACRTGCRSLRVGPAVRRCRGRRACLQSGLPQNRLPSGTCGSVRIAAAGSPLGIRGMVHHAGAEAARLLDDRDRSGPAPCRVDLSGGPNSPRWPSTAREVARRRGPRSGRVRCRRDRSTRRRRCRCIPVRRTSSRSSPVSRRAAAGSPRSPGDGAQIARPPVTADRRRFDWTPTGLGSSPRSEPGGLRLVGRQTSLEFHAAVKQPLRQRFVLGDDAQRRLDRCSQRPQRGGVRCGDRTELCAQGRLDVGVHRQLDLQHHVVLGLRANLRRLSTPVSQRVEFGPPSRRGRRAQFARSAASSARSRDVARLRRRSRGCASRRPAGVSDSGSVAETANRSATSFGKVAPASSSRCCNGASRSAISELTPSTSSRNSTTAG